MYLCQMYISKFLVFLFKNGLFLVLFVDGFYAVSIEKKHKKRLLNAVFFLLSVPSKLNKEKSKKTT